MKNEPMRDVFLEIKLKEMVRDNRVTEIRKGDSRTDRVTRMCAVYVSDRAK